jgi:mannose-6-phosphate isomerase-like protein (cupin superfamily)
MKKTYKPHSKQNKQVNSYRKKTIDPGVDLNIKKDDDNMENIDEYWDMAEYVMDDDKTSNDIKNIPKEAENLVKNKTEKKDKSHSTKKDKDNPTKKDKDHPTKKDDSKKYFMENLESSVINEVMDISTDGSKLTGDYKETLKKKKSETPKKSNKQKNEDTSGEDTLFDIDNIRESLSHNVLKKTSIQSNTSGLDVNDGAGSLNELSNSITNKNEMTPKKFMKKNTKDKKPSKKGSKESIDKLKKGKGKINDTRKNKDSITDVDVNRVSKKKLNKTKEMIKKRRSSVNASYDYKGEPLIGKNSKIYGMTKISSLFQGKSKLEPIITKKSLESGILFLKPGASILNENADVSFTIFLLKGTIEITINNEKFKVSRESCLYVEEGSSYDIIDKSRDGSSILVTFKAK